MQHNEISSLHDDASGTSMEEADIDAEFRALRHESELQGILMKTTLTPVAAKDYLRAISCAATPVTIVTTDAQDTRWGQTVSAVSRVSDEPAILGVCINRRSPINQAIDSAGVFNVSLLGYQQRSVADSFAGRTHPQRPAFTFLDGEWSTGLNGLPIFSDSVAAFECELHSVTVVGSHHLYLGQVSHVVHTDAEPLLHLRGNYRALAAHHTEGQRR